MAITNHERVGKALDLLKHGLAPVRRARVQEQLQGRRLAEAAAATSATTGSSAKKPVAEWDVAALLKLMWEAWNDVFRQDARPRRAHAGAASCATSATSGRTRSRSRATTPTARSTPLARLLTAVSAPQADEVEQDEDGAAAPALRRAGARREAQERPAR